MKANTDSQTRVLLADDHALVRAGIRSLLEKMENVEVVAEAGDGQEACELALELRPDVVLMDLAMKELNGLKATEVIMKELRDTKVVVVSMHNNEEYVLQALRAGAVGYVRKDDAAHELELALNAVQHGRSYLSPTISRGEIDDYLNRTSDQDTGANQLTRRQREILTLIAQGKNTKEVAFTLGLSVKTVETHRGLLMQRLKTYDIPGLVRFAMRNGMVPGEHGLS